MWQIAVADLILYLHSGESTALFPAVQSLENVTCPSQGTDKMLANIKIKSDTPIK